MNPDDRSAPTRLPPALSRIARVFSFLLPRTRTSLFAMFEADRFLLWATVIMLGCAWVPLLLAPFMPFADMGINTASADLIWDTASGVQPTASFYMVQWAPLPYWTTYGLCSVVGKMFGPLVAGKVLTALVLAMLPLGTMRLLLAFGRDPRLGLWTFALSWEHNLYAGWLALLIGIALVSFVLAWIVEARTIGDGLRIAPYTALIALTHAQAAWLLAMAGGAITFTTGPLRRRLILHAAAFAGIAVIMGPWLVGRLLPSTGPPASLAQFSFEWHSPAVKLSQFFAYTMDNFARPDAERAAAVTFAVLILGPLLLTLLPAKAGADRRSPVVLLLIAGGFYALMPWAIGGPIFHWYTYPRYATLILLWLPLIPTPRLRGWPALALAPGILAALTMDVKAAEQFAGFGRSSRPYLQIIEKVPPKAAVLAIVLDDSDPDPFFKLWPYHQFYAYITAFNHGYSPYLWGAGSIPLVNRPGHSLPSPNWDGVFSMNAHGRYYDYIMVQGIQHGDPIATAGASADGRRAYLVAEVDRWRLYAVK